MTRHLTRHLIGIDVGTGSARAGVFDTSGAMIGMAKTDIALYREAGGIVEQSSAEIWRAVCASVRGALAGAGVAPQSIAGMGVDATCSLVVLGAGGTPLAVGPSENAARDIIVWMDHRATRQAERINATGHAVLRYVGGRISPEMQTPKLLWLRETRPAIFDAAWQFMDLTDFLTWKASGSLARSTCTVTCKWTYLAHENRWDASYFRRIGLGVLADEGFARIGTRIVPPGTPLGVGLTEVAAAALGLPVGTPVGAGLIDAHAGGIGTVGTAGDPTRSLGYVFGTSSCTMTTTREPAFVPGVWGPYHSAMVPGLWLNEGGQSAAGAAIDRLLAMHPAAVDMRLIAEGKGLPLPVLLAEAALEAVDSASEAVSLAGGLHVVPEFLGNRAPFADPRARAVIAGLGLETDKASLIALYVAGICGIGYGLRQIVETQSSHGAPVRQIVISGGAGQHPLVRQLLADATGLPVLAVEAEEPVLLGSAILGAVAAGHVGMTEAMGTMSRIATACEPRMAAAHAERYDAFIRLQTVAREIARIGGGG